MFVFHILDEETWVFFCHSVTNLNTKVMHFYMLVTAM